MTTGILEEIRWPSDWESVPFGRLVDRRKGCGRADLPPLSVFLDEGVVPRESRDDNFNRLGSDMSLYLLVEPGDIVFNKLRTWQGGLGVSEHAGVVSPAYFVCRPREGVVPRFMHFALRSSAYLQELTRVSKWMPPSQFDIGWEDLREVAIRVPPRRLQDAIADYLDAETARIDALIQRRRRIVGILAERRGLTTDRVLAEASSRYRQEWPLVKLKHVVRGFIDTLHATAPGEDEGPSYIVGTGCIKDGSLDLAFAKRCSAETLREWTKRAVPQPGDILLTREAPAGEAALVPDGVALAPGQRVVLVQTNPDLLLPELLLYSIYAEKARVFVDRLSRETTVAHLNVADIGELPLVLPPPEQQAAVAESIRKSVSSMDRLSRAMVRQADILMERRQALITAAVTGQIEIPGVAA